MPRLHKLRRRQKFQYNVNRRLLNKKKEKLPRIKCDAIREAWDERKSLNENLTSMGLVADTNAHKSFHIPSGKQQMMPGSESDEIEGSDVQPKKAVVKALEAESKEAFKSKKAIPHTMPKELVKRLTSFLDKYGEDYEAMSRDYGNYNQETPSQLKAQVSRLKKIPQQWIPYLKSRGLLTSSSTSEQEETDFEILPR